MLLNLEIPIICLAVPKNKYYWIYLSLVDVWSHSFIQRQVINGDSCFTDEIEYNTQTDTLIMIVKYATSNVTERQTHAYNLFLDKKKQRWFILDGLSPSPSPLKRDLSNIEWIHDAIEVTLYCWELKNSTYCLR